MKKFTALFLVLSLLILSVNLYAKKKGAELAVQMKDGQSVKGELIAVRVNSLLLLDSESGVDVSVDIADIKAVKIVKKSKFGLGLLIGGVGTGLAFQLTMSEEHRMEGQPTIETAVLALLGALLGGLIGAGLGQDKTIKLEDKYDSEIKKIMEDLRKKARVKNAQ